MKEQVEMQLKLLMQEQFRGEMYTYLAVVPDASKASVAEDFEGRPYTGNLGGHVAGAHPRHDLVRTGVRNLHANFS